MHFWPVPKWCWYCRPRPHFENLQVRIISKPFFLEMLVQKIINQVKISLSTIFLSFSALASFLLSSMTLSMGRAMKFIAAFPEPLNIKSLIAVTSSKYTKHAKTFQYLLLLIQKHCLKWSAELILGWNYTGISLLSVLPNTQHLTSIVGTKLFLGKIK